MTDVAELATSLKEVLLSASDRMLDPSVRPKIEAWDSPPTSAQVLEVLDMCVHGSLTTGTAVATLDLLLKKIIEHEGTTFEAVVAKATWRNEH
jgi:hypothetical protein